MSTESQLYEIKLKTDQFSSKLDQIESKMNKMESNVGGLGNSFDKLGGKIGSAFSIAAAGYLLEKVKDIGMELVNTAKEFTNMEDAISFASGEDAVKNIEFLNSTVDRLGLNLDSTYKGFKTFQGALMGTSLEGEKGRYIFESVSEAASVMKLSAEQTEGSFLALGQMISKGTVSAEELRGQLGERLPGAFQIFARSLGVSTSKLGDMLKKGEVLADDALPKFADELKKTFSGGVAASQNKFNANWNRFENMILRTKIMLGNELIPLVDSFITKIMEADFSEWTKPLLQIWDSLKGIGSSLADIFDLEGNGGAFLSSLRQLVKDVLLMTNSLVAVVDYVAKRAKAATEGTSADWDKSMSQEQIDSFYERNPGKELTFESVLNDKLQNAADAWSGKKSDSELINDKNKSQFDKLNAFRSQVQMDKLAAQNKTAGSVDSAKSSAGKSIGVEKVASSTRNINISIENLVKEITFSRTESWKETESQFIEKLKRALLTVTNDVNVVAN